MSAENDDAQDLESASRTETVELETRELDAIEMILEDRIEEEEFGAIPTDSSTALSRLHDKIREQRGGA